MRRRLPSRRLLSRFTSTLHYLLSAKTGRNFFDELVRHLYALLQAEYIWLAEVETLPRGLMARVLVSAGIDSAYGFHRYELAEFECGKPLYLRWCDNMAENAYLPAKLGVAEHYWALALFDGKKNVIGHLAMSFSADRYPDPRTLSDLQQLLAYRASAELNVTGPKLSCAYLR